MSMREFCGRDGSNVKMMFETCGKRPSRDGYEDTEFSSASYIAWPVALITTTGSSKGKLEQG